MNEQDQNQERLAKRFCSNPTPPMLVNEIARLFHAKMRSFESDSMMTQDSVRLILRELGHADGCSQLDLVKKTHLKPPTVSVTLRKLEEEGLVKREADPMDLRVTRVYLSEKGQAHHQTVRERLCSVDEMLMQGFDEEETRQLLQFLARMRNNILSENEQNIRCEAQEKIANASQNKKGGCAT